MHRYARQFAWMMRFLGVFYVLCGIVAFFFPAETFYLINVGPKVFHMTEALPDQSERFWQVYATGFMTLLAGVSFFSAQAPRAWGYFIVHVLAKSVTAFGFAYMFLYDRRAFAYALCATVDALLVLVLVLARLRMAAGKDGLPSPGAGVSPATEDPAAQAPKI